MSANGNKKWMSILGILLGLVGIVIGLLGGLAFGTIGAIVAGVIGLIAAALGLLSIKNGGKGKGGIIAGILAIVIAFTTASTTAKIIDTAKEEAQKHADIAPLWAKYSSEAKSSEGFYGILKVIPKDEAGAQELLDEFNKLNDLSKDDSAAAPAAE